MGLLDQIMKKAGEIMGSPGKDHTEESGGIDIAGQAAQLQRLGEFLEQHGLGNVVKRLEEKGLGSVVGSWVGHGDNQPVSADQINHSLGDDLVGRVAQKLGVTPDKAAALLARFLPVIVDKLTPHGKLEGEHLAEPATP